MTKPDDLHVEMENPLDAFLMEAPAQPPARPSPATTPRSDVTAAAGTTAIDARLQHISKESADTRRRITELRRVIDENIVAHTAEIRRLTRTITIAIVFMLALGFAELAVAIWMKL